MKCPTCNSETKETDIICENEEVYCPVCIVGKRKREERLEDIFFGAVNALVEAKVEDVQKIIERGRVK